MTTTDLETVDQRTIIYDFEAVVSGLMSRERLAELPTAHKEAFDALVARAVTMAGIFEDAPEVEALGQMVTALYVSDSAERFVRDPVNDGILMVGGDGELVTLKGAKLGRARALEGVGSAFIKEYSYAMPITGPRQGEHLTPTEYPIPAPQ